MKLLFSHYRHLTEVLLPAVAQANNWSVIHEADIKIRICAALGVPVPVFPSRTQISTHDLKRIVSFCYSLLDNPLIFNLL